MAEARCPGSRALRGWAAALIAALTALSVATLIAATPAVAAADGTATAQPSQHGAPSASGVLRISSVEFCADSAAAFETSGCRWQTVSLPHRWQPAGKGPGWALYRVTVPDPGQPVLGVLTDRLSLHGLVRVGDAVQKPSGGGGHELAHLRYWPQLYLVPIGRAAPGTSVTVEIAVRGHASAKNGLGSLTMAPPALAQALHERELRSEVLALLTLAAATAMAGLLGLAAGDLGSPAGRLLRVTAWIALLAAARMGANFVTAPPLPVAAWTALNVLLLAAIALGTCLVMALALWPARPGLWRWGAGALGVLAAGLALAPVPWFFAWAEVFFAAVSLAALLLLGRLVLCTVRTRDALGASIALPVLGILVLGVHDLVVHLGGRSMSDHYLQKWSVPGLLILTIVLLGRRVAAQRAVEAALSRETERRDELLRDLHDGIGSRLVALSFHARRGGDAAGLGAEIDALLRELQLIQGAVRAGPTTLQALLADLRHQYARIGGGSLPLRWIEPDIGAPVPLSAQQAVATVRIFEEAVANALKHARPRTITVEETRAAAPYAAALALSDDGDGGFEPERGRGLHNMRVRAERAGLGLRLEQPGATAGTKTVRLLFPAPQSWHHRAFSTTGPQTP
jgi:signal transduction histidine kinase